MITEAGLTKGKLRKDPQRTRNLLQAKDHTDYDYDYGYDYRGRTNKGKLRKDPQRTRNLLQAGLASISPNVIVAKDGSGKYTTINEALLEAPQNGNETFVIYIKEGVYQEYVTVNKTSWSVMFIGDGPTKTKVIGNRSKIGGYETFWTSTVAIEGDNFIARDMGFENNAGPDMHQAVAVRVSADKTIFHNCRIDGFQDTLYAHNHRQYYRDCTISGTIDFIFGNARAVLQNCTLVVRKPLESQKLCMVTAQGRTLVNQTSAVVLQNCRIVAGPDYPGRPWKEFSRAIVMDSEIGGLINPGGWSSWNGTDAHLNTCWYAEVDNKGPAADLTRRVKWPGIKRVSIEEAETFTPREYMMGDEWIAGKGVPYDSGRRRPINLD
ncbi:putative pectinesterase/pectinesterase inhibitor 28 [Phtheirospermum japonicum]|uniref:Pectinesterase n=1 Tax=Phtheirospermum japonicum TaxID=374723 RepID=A0A830CS57_9LAMI|nr:putative pectinesterase/pectinesterase inhibitor 28 [Phtheirospermum japonicum]